MQAYNRFAVWRNAALIFPLALMLMQGAGTGAVAATIDELYAAAKKDGKVSVIGPPGVSFRTGLIRAFSERFPGIEIEVTGLIGNQVAAKMKAEGRADIHSFDVVLNGTATGSLLLKRNGLIQPFEDWIVLPDAKDPSKWRGGALHWADPDRMILVVMQSIAPYVVINTDLVKPGELKGDASLLDPKWKGKIISDNPDIPGPGSLHFRRLYVQHGMDYMRQLRAQEPVITKDRRQLIDQVAKGRYAIGIAVSGTDALYYLRRGVKSIDLTLNGTWADPLPLNPGAGAMMLPKHVAHPNAAKLMVNWLLTKEGVDVLVKGIEAATRRLDADVSSIPAFMQPQPGRDYYIGYTEEYLRAPTRLEARNAIKSLNFGK